MSLLEIGNLSHTYGDKDLDQYADTDKEKTILDYLKTAFTPFYQLEKKITDCYMQYAKLEDEKLLSQASHMQVKLESSNFYTIDIRIEKVMIGLGLYGMGAEKRLEELSGGQRAKVILAKLLLEEPDVLLLDEPTNFLDKEHVDWLVEYLDQFENAFVVVSHDFNFLEQITNCICDIEGETIKKYNGKYSEF